MWRCMFREGMESSLSPGATGEHLGLVFYLSLLSFVCFVVIQSMAVLSLNI